MTTILLGILYIVIISVAWWQDRLVLAEGIQLLLLALILIELAGIKKAVR